MVPDGMPGKTRLGRLILRPFMSRKPALLKDRFACRYHLPSYAEPIAQHIFTFGVYEPDTIKVILRLLPENGTFIDVGANLGAIAIPIARARPRATLLCIEADPEIYQLLQVNISDNCPGHVSTSHCIVGPREEEQVAFYRAPDEKFGMGSIAPQFHENPIKLKQRSLDGILKESGINCVDVIKMDVEGAELGVLQGAKRLLFSNLPPAIIFEFGDWAEARVAGQRPGDAQALLFRHGYRLFRLGRDGALGEEFFAPMREGSSMLVALAPKNLASNSAGLTRD